MITQRVNTLDEKYMLEALKLAEMARAEGEVPVGALIVKDGSVISKAYNLRETSHSAIAHAEVLAISQACEALKTWRLEGCTLYVTLEPCLMCAGAIVQARVPRVVFGALDSKGGAVESLYQALSDERLNHRCEVLPGVLAEDCGRILTEFFKERRQSKSRP